MWNDELIELLRVPTATVDLADEQAHLLQRVVDAPLMPLEALPFPTPSEQAVPEQPSAAATFYVGSGSGLGLVPWLPHGTVVPSRFSSSCRPRSAQVISCSARATWPS